MASRPAVPTRGTPGPPAKGVAGGHTRPRAVKPVERPARGRTAGRARGARGEALEQGFLWMLAIGRRGVVIGLALAVLIAFAAGTVEQRWKELKLRDQVAAQNAVLQAAQERNAALQAQLAESDPDAYRAWVEATASRRMAGANSPPAAATTPATTAPAEANWRKWWRLLAGD